MNENNWYAIVTNFIGNYIAIETEKTHSPIRFQGCSGAVFGDKDICR